MHAIQRDGDNVIISCVDTVLEDDARDSRARPNALGELQEYSSGGTSVEPMHATRNCKFKA